MASALVFSIGRSRITSFDHIPARWLLSASPPQWPSRTGVFYGSVSAASADAWRGAGLHCFCSSTCLESRWSRYSLAGIDGDATVITPRLKSQVMRLLSVYSPASAQMPGDVSSSIRVAAAGRLAMDAAGGQKSRATSGTRFVRDCCHGRRVCAPLSSCGSRLGDWPYWESLPVEAAETTVWRRKLVAPRPGHADPQVAKSFQLPHARYILEPRSARETRRACGGGFCKLLCANSCHSALNLERPFRWGTCVCKRHLTCKNIQKKRSR